MMRHLIQVSTVLVMMLGGPVAGPAQKAAPDVKVMIDHNVTATAAFRFPRVPSPVKDDAGAKADLLLIEGARDENGASLRALTDGILPKDQDDPGANFFFNAGTPGGAFRMDLGSAIDIAEVNTYSWHPNTRGPQVYALYASDGSDPKFNATPKGDVDPAAAGWVWIATVDTRLAPAGSGQYGVSITKAGGSLGKYRYLLFECYATEADDDFGNTFYSEIDVIAKKPAVAPIGGRP
jgi:hypothetical protein